MICRIDTRCIVGQTTTIVRCILMLAMVAGSVRAQESGSAAPPPPTSSGRPVLVSLEFEGNDDSDLNDKVLKAQIKSKATEKPTVRRIFTIFANVYDANPLMPQHLRDEMHAIVDSLSGDVRYLNPRLLKEDTVELRKIYDQFGYHEVQLDYRVVIDTAKNRSVVRYFIDQGPRYSNAGITYLGIDEVPPQVTDRFREPAAFEVGDDFRTSDVVDESARAVAALQNEGYPFAARSALVTIKHLDSNANRRVDSTLASIYTGNRYRFGETVYMPDPTPKGPPLKDWVVMRQIEYTPGEWYSRERVDQTISNLYGLGVFEYVRLDSLASRSTDDTLAMQLIVKLQDPKTLLITPEVSFERYVNDYYSFVGLSSMFTDANLLGGAEKFTVQARVRTPTSNFSQSLNRWTLLTYGATISYMDQTLLGARRRSFQTTLGYDRAIEDRVIECIQCDDESNRTEFTYALTSDRFFGAVDGTHRFPKYTFISTMTLRLSGQHLQYSGVGDYIRKKAQLRVQDAINARDLAPELFSSALTSVNEAMVNSIFREQVWLGDETAIVNNPFVVENFASLKNSFIVSLSVTGDHRDDFFSPRNGDFIDARSEFGTNSFVNQWWKGEFEFRRFAPFGDDKTVGLRLHAGLITPFGPIKLVPLTSRFWAGGSNSLRGWGPREMLITSPPTSLDSNKIGPQVIDIVTEVLKDGRRLLGGLAVFEVMGDLRWRPFNFPATSTLMQQINNLMLVVGMDVGAAFFRDYEEDKASFKRAFDGIGVSPSIAFGYDTPIGPLRVGFGWAFRDPVNYPDHPWLWERPLRMNDWVWFFAIGHAF